MWLLTICSTEKWSGFNWKKAGSVLNANSWYMLLMRFSAAGLIDTSQKPEEAVRFEQADLAVFCPGFLQSGRAVSRSKPPFQQAVSIAEHYGFKAPFVGGLPRQIHLTIHSSYGH
ncbi:hypothetical protein [Methylobacter sp. YRD-M1]|uniref:hypothetical protein n=1 Tax=Methylobacter sp. YRD-M1 TaxID=2911520 RepID=UPI00227A5586|nr:hypothetical protein [Methylobacter sp. YRD-M1]WAK02946.1 hypothetical protein LZ558_03930 [Methylobacter sp. YRD-M1]